MEVQHNSISSMMFTFMFNVEHQIRDSFCKKLGVPLICWCQEPEAQCAGGAESTGQGCPKCSQVDVLEKVVSG